MGNSHIILLVWIHLPNKKKFLIKLSLDGPLPKMCPIWRQRCSSSNIVNFDHLLYSNIRWHYWLVPDRFLLGIQDLTFDGGFKAFKWPDLVYGCLSCRHRNNIEKYKLALFLRTGKSKIFQKHLVCI
jgi:hypothetical protein